MTFDNDRQKRNYILAKTFLKEAGLWQHWKSYIYDLADKENRGILNLPSIAKKKGKWWDVDCPDEVFGKANFTDYLATKGIKIKNYCTIYNMFANYRFHFKSNDDIEGRMKWVKSEIVK